MLGTLRFRLTALFLGVVLVFGLVVDRARGEAVPGRHARAVGRRAPAGGVGARRRCTRSPRIRSSDEGAKAPEFAAKKLELATGDELYYIGASLFPGQRFGLTRLPRSALGGAQLDRDRPVIVTFTPPGERPQPHRGRAAGAARRAERSRSAG